MQQRVACGIGMSFHPCVNAIPSTPKVNVIFDESERLVFSVGFRPPFVDSIARPVTAERGRASRRVVINVRDADLGFACIPAVLFPLVVRFVVADFGVAGMTGRTTRSQKRYPQDGQACSASKKAPTRRERHHR